MTKSRELRILFTSVGRRVELLQEFRRASETLGIKLIIWGVDITENAPALCFCDKWELICRINNPNYISQLVELCKREKIDALIPTIDTDLLLLSRSQSEFSAVGTKVIISGEDKVQICRDKRYTADYFVSCGLLSPIPTDDYQHYTGGFPAFIKPKDGSSSIFAYKVNNEAELCAYAPQVPNYIIQPFVKGTEYTDFTYIDDIVEGVIRVMQKPPEKKTGEDGLPAPPYAVYNIGNNHPENLLDFVQILSEELVRAGVLPTDYDFDAHKELVPMQPGDVPVTYADTTPLERDFGFKPSTPLREGLRKFAEWYKEYYLS